MKKIVLIGASGFIGSAILKEALNRDHKVTAIVRQPEKIKAAGNNLTIKKCDIFNTAALTELCKGADAVISSYNPGWTNPQIAADTTNGYDSIITAVKLAGIKRLQIVGGAGSLFISPGKRLMDSGAMPESYLPAVKALADVYLDRLSKESELDWIFFSPAGNIAPGERTGKFRLGMNDMIIDSEGKSNISVEDYAVAMIDELEQQAHHRERFTIGY
jgi:uncharacterized protein